MLKWFSAEEGEPGSAAQGSPHGAAGGGEAAVAELAERLAQTEQLVTQLKELIREKDAALHAKDEQLKVEKEACEAKLSKLRLQNKAKVTSLTAQLEELKKKQGGQDASTHHKKGASEGGEQANRGKIVLLKKKLEEMEQQLAQREEELENQRKEVASHRQRGEEMDAMLTEKDRKLAEKEAYIIHLQTSMTGDPPVTPAPQQKVAEDGGAVQELQLLVQSLTTKVGEADERYSLLQEQTESLRDLLATEKEQYGQKEAMYKQNIQTFKDIMLQKDNQLTQLSQMHEQELFRLAAKSDASADLEQLLKALKQKLHEKEEVLLGKAQVIDVLQGEVDGRDEQIKELAERLRRLQVERESLESRMEAEKHVMRAQLRDLMANQQVEVQRMAERHQAQMARTQQDLVGQLEELRKASNVDAPDVEASGSRNSPADSACVERLAELEAQAKQKTDEANKSEAKFLKMKAWSKSRIRQLEEELKKSQSGVGPPDLTALRNHVTALEEEREEHLWKLEQYEELKTKNDMLEAKLVVYEEQQRTLQADLEQFTKRAASQASESGSADDTQSHVLEWQEMVSEAVSARDRAREEKAAMALRISHMEEEREALATRQQELEEELAQARGLGQHRAKKLAAPAQRSLREDFDFDGQPPFQDACSTSESTTPMEGENMGGWWPEYSTPDPDGLRSVVEELELERNQLQEQILSLEERCHDLEDRLQLQARIEALQNESEKLQNQLASVRLQQSKEAEEHRLLVSSLNDQVKGLSDTQESLESSLIEKANTLAETSEKLELINNLRQSLSEKQIHYKEVSDKLFQTEHTLDSISKKLSSSEKQCSELKTEVGDLTQKLSALKEKTQKQEVTIDALQAELDQTNEELDKLNTTHLEERAQLIHDLQSCEREIDSLKDLVSEKEKEISTLSGNMAEYAEQVTMLKQEIKLKEESLVHVESALCKAQREAMIIRDSQNSDQQVLNGKITELDGKLKDTEMELAQAKQESASKAAEVEHLIKQAKEDKKTIQDLRSEIQKHTVSHRNHLSECETRITSLKEQLALSTRKLQEETEALTSQLKDKNTINEKLQQQLRDKEQTHEKEVKSFKEEQNKLLVQAQKYNDDVQALSKQLEVQVQGEERIQKAMEEKLETIASLENQLKVIDQQAEDEKKKFSFDLQARDSENQKLNSEVQSKENVLKSMNVEKLQMQEKLKGLTEELEAQNQTVKQLRDELTSVLELNSGLEKQVDGLTKANEKVQLEVAESVKSISELTVDNESLRDKISTYEAKHLQSAKLIEGLQQDKEDLTARANELNRVLEQSTNSNSEVLLAKTNECIHLKQLLQEREERLKQTQEERQSLISKVNQLQDDVAEKDKAVADLQAEIVVQRRQQTQLQETLSLLREQESVLKSGLLENDAVLKQKEEECHSLRSEVTHQKSFTSKLQADTESLKEERVQLHHQINERERMLKDVTQQCQKHEEELSAANKTVTTLRDLLASVEDDARKLESEKTGTIMSLEKYEKENAELKQQLDQGQSELASLHARIQAVSDENQRIRAACDSKETELAQKAQMASDLDVQLKVALEEKSTFNLKISGLTEDNQRLQEDLEQNMKSVSELTAERSSLEEKMTGLEFQISENHKVIDGLLKEKEQIAVAADRLKKVLEENELLTSADLLEKTRTCEVLSQEVDALKTQVAQLNLFLSEKERTVSEQSSQLQARQNQLVQLQDTVSMLQEQGSALKSGLMEKDALVQQKEEEVCVYQKDAVLQKELVSQLRGEVESLKGECLEGKVQLERKEKTLQDVIHELQNHKDELSKRNESVLSLSTQLGVMNGNAAEMEAEIGNLKASVQNLGAEKDRREIEVNDCKDNIVVLNEQNARLKSELQKSVAELSNALADVADLKSTVCEKDDRVSNLRQEVNRVCSERERLNLMVQEKQHSLKQQEDFIQQLNGKNAEQELQLKEKEDDNCKLKIHISELEESVVKLRGRVDSLLSESSDLKDHLEKKEQSSLECQSSSAAVAENLSSNLEAKEAECESLKEQVSHLEESVAKLNAAVQVQMSETESLKKSMEEKAAALLEQSKSLQDASRRADEALLFKAQYTESTELVAQLQSQIQLLATESENLRRSAEETQSAFNNLQEKYAVDLEELHDVRKQLSQRAEEVSSLRKLLEDTNSEHEMAKTTIETLRNELSVGHRKLDKAQELNSSLSKEKEEAFSSHQASVSLLTVEIERLKSQHLQVVAQMNALTENLEQREMALHAINNQYTAQAKHAAQLVSEVQQLKTQNKRLNQEITGSKEELQKQLGLVGSENTHLQEELRRVLSEKDQLERRHRDILTTQGEARIQMEQQSGSAKQRMEKMVLEKESLQTEVSAKDGEISRLKTDIQKLEQILQDSEKEWLLVLDREKQEKNLLAEQLQSVETESNSKDVKMNVLKQDLDSLQTKLAEADSVIRLGSEQLVAKESEASASRIQLENALASVQEKDGENERLRQTLDALEQEMHEVVARKTGSGLNEEKPSLQTFIRRLEESHQSEVESLKNQLAEASAQLQKATSTLNVGEESREEKCQQIALLQETVERLQTELHAESEKVKEAGLKVLSLHGELESKEEQTNCMSVQASQQKELLAGLSQQLKEKNASIAQVMESASNERLKFAEEKHFLTAQLESMDRENKAATKKIEDISRQLEEHAAHARREIEAKNLENDDLIKEIDHLKNKLASDSKEKNTVKKKLQAALIVRKELLRKIEEYETQKAESSHGATEVSVLKDKLLEATSQAEAAANMYEEKILVLEKKMVEREENILEHKRESEHLLEKIQTEKETLQSALNEKEASLTETARALAEKSSAIERLRSSLSEKEDAFEEDRKGTMQKLEELQNEIKKSQADLKDKDSSTVDVENELAQLKLDQATLQKKARAALLARKETMKKAQEQESKLMKELAELKDDYKALLEQHCQQTNQLNNVQLNFDKKVQELEDLQKASLSNLDELDTLRQLVGEKDKTLQDLKMSLAEKESQCHTLPSLQTDLESMKSRLERLSVEMAEKDETAEALKVKLALVENDLVQARAEVKGKAEEFDKHRETIDAAERKARQERRALTDEILLLKNRLSVSQSELEEQKRALNARVCSHEQECQLLMEEKKALLEQSDQLKADLEAAVASDSQRSLEVLTVQKTLAETLQRLSEDRDVLTKELEKTKLLCAEKQSNLELMKQEKENAFRVTDDLRDEVAALSDQLTEANKQKEQLRREMSEVCVKQGDDDKCAENYEVKLKERDDALLLSQAQLVEKEGLIAALELQLQQQIKAHQLAMDKARTEVDELHKSRQDGAKNNDQDDQSRVALLTRKLQAALVSRKELFKENATLKERVQNLSSEHEAKEAQRLLELKEQKVDLESRLNKEKEKLSTEVDRILNDNRSLSAACESLKLTIESITQQKQAFSCQLESLKDSQAEELSKWKSKHSELKQEYESLLQAYENVSSEMDKMRQLLEGAKRERQEALRKIHKHEAEAEILEKQTRELEEEKERMEAKLEAVEEANGKMRRELSEVDGSREIVIRDLTVKNQQLEAQISELKASSEGFRERLAEVQAENIHLTKKLEETSSFEKTHVESKSCVNDMRLQLDEALTLNNSLTAQFEAQKTELGAQFEINNLLHREKQTLSDRMEMMQNDHELQLGRKECVMKELQDVINRNGQETISLNEKVRILEDDKSLLQEELENVQENSDKVKNENEYLETVILKNSERIDELTESVAVLQTQNAQLSSQLAAGEGKINRVCQEKEEEQLRLVREFEQKLKTFQRGNEGSKNVKKELQELLKEKHHEIKQLQQNSINYQEVILDLENSLKSSQSTCEHFEQELKKSSGKILALEERSKEVEAELSRHKNLFLEAKKTMESVQSERDQLAQEALRRSKTSDREVVEGTKSPQQTNEKQINSSMESQVLLQQQLEDLQKIKDQESQKVTELRQQIDAQDIQINMLKRAAETNEAKLSALASTPHGADSLRHWNELYQKSLHEKDSQLLEQGFVIKRFLEDMRAKEKEVNELRVTKSRLERTLNEYSVAAAAQQRQVFVTSASNAELTETVELMAVQVKELSSRVEGLEQEKNALDRQLADQEDAMSQVQLNLRHVEKMNADLDAQLVLFQSQNDKAQADFEKQEGISLQLKTLLQSKDAEISSLLSCRDGQMSGFIEQLQANYRSQVAVYEDRLTSLRYQKERVDKALRGLETKVRNLQSKVDRSVHEREQTEAKMESFRNSMVSLQSERERLMSENRILEAKNQLVLKGKDDSADGEVGTAKGFKHEIRKLLHQMDDLNSENAMLRAQLVRYREDLNQVLSLKDNQLKGLLKKQHDVIKNLENQKAAAEKQHRACRAELQKEEETNDVLKTETSKLQAQVQKLQSDIHAQKQESVTTNEGRVIADLQQVVAAKAAECNDLQQKLVAQKVLTDEQKDKIKQLENETDKKLSEAEDKFNSELDTFEQEVELMRNQRETADQRLAELAKELLETEQQLSDAKAQNQGTRAQNESLCKAMAALQNDRDQLIEDFKVLQNRYDEELRETQSALTKAERSLQDATSDLAMFAKEKDILVQKMKALESKDAHSELSKLLDGLSKDLSGKERELKRVSLENDTCRRQLSAFSRSMASLQNDRDRLVDELAEAKSAVESRQWTSPGSVASVAVEKSKDGFTSAFQNEREGLNNRQTIDRLQKAEQRMQTYTPQREKEVEVGSYREEMADLRSDVHRRHNEDVKEPTDKKDTQLMKQEPAASAGRGGVEEVVSRLETERIQLHRDLQRCMYEIQQRDQYFQQLNVKLQQVVEEKGVVAAQLRAVSQTLRNTQNRCHWLENQVQGQAQGAVFAEDAPGAPQERNGLSITVETDEASQLRERLVEVEQILSEERSRREAAEEALRLAEERTESAGSSGSRDGPRDFSIQLDAEEEWEAASLDPNQPLISRKVKGGMAACRQWLRGRSLYFSKLLTSRGRSRYLFLAYLLTLHVLVFMCLSGAL